MGGRGNTSPGEDQGACRRKGVQKIRRRIREVGSEGVEKGTNHEASFPAMLSWVPNSYHCI